MRRRACLIAVASAALLTGWSGVADAHGCRRCGGDRDYVWHRYTVSGKQDYSRRYYNPFVGPPCRVGIYYGRGRGLIGIPADEWHFRRLHRRW